MQKLLDIMRLLRNPETGCPWDLDQDFASIAPHTIEEAYEVADAIQRQQMDQLKDELGDLLFQVAFHAQMAEEGGHFNFADVVESICDKMQRRHPHVFGDAKISSSEQQTQAWEAMKAEERLSRGENSLMDDVPAGMAELQRSMKLQRRAGEVGFDWPNAEPVFAKILEELDELAAETEAGDPDRLEDEMGDVLFACTNLARQLKIDPARALRHANHKFESRFRAMEEKSAGAGHSMADMNLDEMESLWQQVKRESRDT
jgi:ATP diphosphatase